MGNYFMFVIFISIEIYVYSHLRTAQLILKSSMTFYQNGIFEAYTNVADDFIDTDLSLSCEI